MAGERSLERESYWRGVIRKQQASGMSIAAFCREFDLAPAAFYNWRRKLQPPGSGDHLTSNHAAAKFVPIELTAPPVARPVGCEVVLPDGCRVIASGQCDPNWLREIIQVVQERAC